MTQTIRTARKKTFMPIGRENLIDAPQPLSASSYGGEQVLNNFNNFFLEFFRNGCQLESSVKEFEEIVSRLSQCEKTEALDDLLLKASVILNDGFLSWQVFVALQHQALLSSGFSPSRPAFDHN
jgi:hypothetical protein